MEEHEESFRVGNIRAAMRDEAHLAWCTCLFVGLAAGTSVIVTGLAMLVPDDPEGWLVLVALGAAVPLLALVASMAMGAIFFVRWLRRAYADVTLLERVRMPFTRSQLLWVRIPRIVITRSAAS